jgi:hypothetical protein
MAKNIVIIAGVIAVVIGGILMVNKLDEKDAAINTAVRNVNSSQEESTRLKSENRRLADRASALEKELVVAKSALVQAPKDKPDEPTAEMTAPESAALTEGTGSSLSLSTFTGITGTDRIARMVELGKLFARLGKRNAASREGNPGGSDHERMRITGEMMKIMADLEIGDINRLLFTGNLSILNDPDTRKLFVNVAVGVFDELGTPMTKDQVGQYESVLERLASLEKGIVNDSQTPAEKAIARLQNADAINAMLNEISNIFTAEQKTGAEAIEARGGGRGPGPQDRTTFPSQMNMLKPSVQSWTLSSTKERARASEQVLDRWTGGAAASREAVKPLADQYVAEYAGLKKSYESAYGKELMDYYLDRRPGDSAGRQNYNQSKSNFIQANPGYEVTKRAMDIEFLQLQNKYQKEVARLSPPAAEATSVTVTNVTPGVTTRVSPMTRQSAVNHFPNLD